MILVSAQPNNLFLLANFGNLARKIRAALVLRVFPHEIFLGKSAYSRTVCLWSLGNGLHPRMALRLTLSLCVCEPGFNWRNGDNNLNTASSNTHLWAIPSYTVRWLYLEEDYSVDLKKVEALASLLRRVGEVLEWDWSVNWRVGICFFLVPSCSEIKTCGGFYS